MLPRPVGATEQCQPRGVATVGPSMSGAPNGPERSRASSASAPSMSSTSKWTPVMSPTLAAGSSVHQALDLPGVGRGVLHLSSFTSQTWKKARAAIGRPDLSVGMTSVTPTSRFGLPPARTLKRSRRSADTLHTKRRWMCTGISSSRRANGLPMPWRRCTSDPLPPARPMSDQSGKAITRGSRVFPRGSRETPANPRDPGKPALRILSGESPGR